MYDRTKPVKKNTIIKAVATCLALILVLIFAPRMDGPRIINGVEFTTKGGLPGLTNLGWILLVSVPIITFLVTSLILKLTIKKANDSKNTK